MAIRQRRVDIGTERARGLLAMTSREFKNARANSALSQAEVSIAAGMSRSQYGRIELGLSPDLSIANAARIAAALGLEMTVRYFPVAEPVRDAAHAALLERLRARCHPALRMRTEVPLPHHGDLRAWDAVIDGFAGSMAARVRGGVEAETRPLDVQALERKLALKERDGDVAWLILLVADTRHNRAFLRGPGEALKARFPLDGRRALAMLAAGLNPGSSAIILL
jgi:transcriptional regulator with XRE-family HTH domain